MKKKKALKVKFTIERHFARTEYLSDDEIDRMRLEIFRKTGWKPMHFHQKKVTVNVQDAKKAIKKPTVSRDCYAKIIDKP